MPQKPFIILSALIAATLLSACATVESPIMDRISTVGLTRAQASKDLVAGLLAAKKCNGEAIRAVKVRGAGFELTDEKGQTFKFTFAEAPAETFLPAPWFSDHLKLPGCEICWNAKMGVGGKEEQIFMNALTFFKQDVKDHPTAYVDSGDFDLIVKKYQKMKKKPELPEEARKLQIQAFSAVDTKKFEHAADCFQRALDLAPWWSQGYFNLALTLAELGDFPGAVTAMQKYLKLEPGASDARDAKDKIYEWEDK